MIDNNDLIQSVINFSFQNDIDIMRNIIIGQIDSNYYITTDGCVISFNDNKGKVLQQYDNGKGYKQVKILGRNYYIHRLVAYVYYRLDIYNTDIVVHHIDRNKSNNSLKNLIPLSKKRHKIIHQLLNKWDEMEVV